MRKNILFYLAAALILVTVYRNDYRHNCTIDNCPYKGLTSRQAEALNRQLNDEGTDSYYIDITHFDHPALNYDSLESMLFNNQ